MQGSPFLQKDRASILASAEQVFWIIGPTQDAVARFLHQPQHARHVDAHQIAAPLLHLSANEDRFDMAGIHHVHDRDRCVVERPHVEPIGAQA